MRNNLISWLILLFIYTCVCDAFASCRRTIFLKISYQLHCSSLDKNMYTSNESPNLLKKIQSFADELKIKDKFSKESMTKLGLYALLSYGFVSNFSYISCVIIAWCIHGKNSGMSPLAPDQWKGFLLVYAGLFAANNVIRPLRFSAAVLLAPKFEDIIDFIKRKSNLTIKWATALTVFLVNVCGTLLYIYINIHLF